VFVGRFCGRDADLANLVRAMSMKSAGKPHRPTRGKVISIAIIAIGVAMGLYVEHRISIRPSTDDAAIDADVVHVAAASSPGS
jgi:multidrug resistance efflux pump